MLYSTLENHDETFQGTSAVQLAMINTLLAFVALPPFVRNVFGLL